MKKPLSPDQWNRLGELFDQALALSDSARGAFLEELKNTDALLASELCSLLESHGEAGDFLETSLTSQFWEAVANSKSVIFGKGEKVQNFEIEKELGTGAFATVYLAKEISLNRAVALKVSANQGSEARTMASLDHDHIVKVYSETVDAERNLRLVCMQYVPGISLAGLLQKRPPEKTLNGAGFFEVLDTVIRMPSLFSPSALKDREGILRTTPSELVAWMGVRLSNALGYAHEKGVLHLDVKPANILLNTYGRPFLADFNVSLNQNEGPQTLLGGTLSYMSPEQREIFEKEKTEPGPVLDARSDIYSLGVVLREWLAQSHGREAASPRLLRILDRCTDLNPKNRFANAEELSQALSSFLEYESVFRALPPPGVITAFALKRPLPSLTIGILIPQIIASIVNIVYNGIRIVGNLNGEQKEFFKTLCLIFNPVIYLICVSLILWKKRPLNRFLAEAGRPMPSREAIRKTVLKYSWWVTGVSTGGWLTGAIYFPLGLHLFRGPVGPNVFIQFAISFVLSCLIAGAYSFLTTQFFCLRVIYPQLWEGENQIRNKARLELRRENTIVSRLYFLTGFIPLFSATLLVFIGPEDLTPSGYRFYRYFVTLLLLMGILGFRFSLQAAGQLTKTLSAFTDGGDR